MKVALLNRIITVQRHTAVKDEIGNHLNTWTAFYTCHATVSGETDTEAEEAGTTVDDTRADFTLRWCAASSVITPTEYRVVMDGQIYDILSVDHMNFKHKSVKLHCRKARR